MRPASFTCRDGTRLAYRDVGTGMPFLFQHGLGGDDRQVAEVFPVGLAARRVTLECRGQGHSSYGPIGSFSLATFTDDVAGLHDQLTLHRAVIGGISMGAAIALRSAVLWPRRFRALVLARPAWISQPKPPGMQPYAVVGDLLLRYDPDEARERFMQDPITSHLRSEAPDNLASLLGFFSRTPAKAFGALLKAIAADGPGVSEHEIAKVDVPTLVIGHDRDLVHPLAYARQLATMIPRAKLRVITPKAEDREAYARDFRAALGEFLERLV